MRFLLCLLLIGLCLDSARADALDDALAVVRQAPPAKRKQAVMAVLALKPERAVLLSKLAAGVPVAPIGAGWHVLAATDKNGIARPFHLYVPESARGAERPPLLVYMHGGVSRPAYPDRVNTYGRMWTPYADENGFVIAYPMARGDCMWWRAAGVAHVSACIREVKRLVTIDDNRIIGTGFSDGASGSYHLAMAAPDPFAGFIPMNGHPAVPASASGEQLYLHNLKHVPLLVAATRDDQLYPAAAVIRHLLPSLEQGAHIRIISYETGNHRPVYFEEQAEGFANFVTNTVRDPRRPTIDWWSAAPSTGRASWLELIEFGETTKMVATDEDINIMSTPGRVRLGINIDRAFEGPGLKVSVVTERSNALRMGLQVGDVIHEMDGKPIVNLRDLQVMLADKKYGQPLQLQVQRGDQEPVTLDGAIEAFKSVPYYLRKKPTAHVAARIGDGEVGLRVRGVRHLRVHLAPQEEPHESIKLVLNGVAIEARPVPVSVRAIVEAWAAHCDSGRVYSHYLDVMHR